MEPFEHVVIVGCGLLGASLGLALRDAKLARQITGVGRAGSPSLSIARQRGAIDRATDDLAAAVSGTSLDATVAPADLVVVCTPVGQFPEMFRHMAPVLAPCALITDVGSTKAQVMQWAAEILPAHAQFVGSHPMAGSEKNGPEFARVDLYQNAVCLVCAGTAKPDAVERIENLWRALGMRVIACDAPQHDRWVAAISHLPHVLAACLVNTVSDDKPALAAAAGGFVDTTRVASGDAAMWTDILLTNKMAVVEMLRKFEGEIAVIRDAVESSNVHYIHTFLQSAKAARDQFMAQRRADSGGG